MKPKTLGSEIPLLSFELTENEEGEFELAANGSFEYGLILALKDPELIDEVDEIKEDLQRAYEDKFVTMVARILVKWGEGLSVIDTRMDAVRDE
jgi:hypothetical protein